MKWKKNHKTTGEFQQIVHVLYTQIILKAWWKSLPWFEIRTVQSFYNKYYFFYNFPCNMRTLFVLGHCGNILTKINGTTFNFKLQIWHINVALTPKIFLSEYYGTYQERRNQLVQGSGFTKIQKILTIYVYK